MQQRRAVLPRALPVLALVLAACQPQTPDESAAAPTDVPVPERLRAAVPMLTDPQQALSSRLVYEANNALMRQGLEEGGAIAERWRRTARRTGGLFVLRDSLWNQQDHARRHDPVALMLPPSWILLAAVNRDLAPVRAFEVTDDAAWTALQRPEDLFGGYPPSRALFRYATADRRGADRGRRADIRNARLSLRALSEYTRALQSAASEGWRSVMTTGARIIAAADRAYFTAPVRSAHVIPIFVENPALHEVGEGKGFVVPGLDAGHDKERFLVQQICRARLRDGDIALERYDLSDPRAVARALEILQAVIPPGETLRTRVWLWVTGTLVPGKTLRGEGPLAHVAAFQRKVAALPIDRDRLRLFAKPAEPLDDDFPARLAAYSDAGLFMSVDGATEDLLSAAGEPR